MIEQAVHYIPSGTPRAPCGLRSINIGRGTDDISHVTCAECKLSISEIGTELLRAISDMETELEGPVDLEKERRLRAVADHFTRLNSQLLAPTEELARAYISLRISAVRYCRLLDLDAPQTLLDNEIKLIRQALAWIDPEWMNY